MATEIFLPECLVQAFKQLYPTLDFSRISFFNGIPTGLDTGQPAITVPDPGGICGIHVYLRENSYDPCCKETFLTLAHELVHALQIKDGIFGGCGLGLINPFTAQYITCFLNSLSEAFDFANGPIDRGDPPGKVRCCIEKPELVLPCDCGAVPWPGINPAFYEALKTRCLGLSKTESDASFAECLLKPGGVGGVIGGAILGGPIGAVIGAVVGGLIGGLTGLVGAIGGIIGSIVGGIIGGIVSLLGDLIDAISDLFTGDGVGSIAIMFSIDQGTTFGNKVRLERSSEQPALTGSADRLYVSWTGTDDHLNLFAVPNPPQKVTFDRSNDDSGPAVAFFLGQISVLWQDDDNHLHLKFAPPPPTGGVFALGSRIDLGESLAGSTSPGLAFGSGRLYASWIDDDNRIFIKSFDGVNWGGRVPTNERSPDDGTPALAFGSGRLYLAWTGTDDDNHVGIKSFTALPDGNLTPLAKTTLPERSSDDAGPALAFNNGRLFLGWTDNNQRVKMMFSDDPDARIWSPKIDIGHSSDNAGPALAVVGSSIICIAWIDK